MKSGFVEENLAVGDGPKVVRSVEKAPFTLPAVRLRVTEEELDRALRLRREPDPMSKLTAVDRMLEEHEFGAIAWYAITFHRREVGRPARMRYDDTPRGMIEASSTSEERWRLDLAALEWVEERLHMAGKEVLEMIVWQVFPDLYEGTPPSKIDVGRSIIKVQGRDRAEGGYEAYLRCMAQIISEMRAEWAIDYNRRKDRKAMARVAGHRQDAEKLFGERPREKLAF